MYWMRRMWKHDVGCIYFICVVYKSLQEILTYNVSVVCLFVCYWGPPLGLMPKQKKGVTLGWFFCSGQWQTSKRLADHSAWHSKSTSVPNFLCPPFQGLANATHSRPMTSYLLWFLPRRWRPPEPPRIGRSPITYHDHDLAPGAWSAANHARSSSMTSRTASRPAVGVEKMRTTLRILTLVSVSMTLAIPEVVQNGKPSLAVLTPLQGRIRHCYVWPSP